MFQGGQKKAKAEEATMTIISSQHYINQDIVERKMTEIKDREYVLIPCSYVGIIDGVEYAMQNDGHHTLAAARELGLEIRFSVDDDPEGLTGEELLESRYMDGDYYDVETSNPAYDDFTFVW